MRNAMTADDIARLQDPDTRTTAFIPSAQAVLSNPALLPLVLSPAANGPAIRRLWLRHLVWGVALTSFQDLQDGLQLVTWANETIRVRHNATVPLPLVNGFAAHTPMLAAHSAHPSSPPPLTQPPPPPPAAASRVDLNFSSSGKRFRSLYELDLAFDCVLHVDNITGAVTVQGRYNTVEVLGTDVFIADPLDGPLRAVVHIVSDFLYREPPPGIPVHQPSVSGLPEAPAVIAAVPPLPLG
ncbi:hypothetical protein HXX76_012238 [Chlamydomonas incerta]|uniref:FAS1 domain-containing protein n=1 Tax=Chlamydomonas incerta TaxID=51695 RepID=A0A835SIG3_CHLIN|nr:hypothetical protein HXX76_012238 [Chlamydomonas incerta]|eukprot:KAG2427584.1 hypothetical protein HXX76_012238 [Chlamydomonas incerta]